MAMRWVNSFTRRSARYWLNKKLIQAEKTYAKRASHVIAALV